jgi:glutamate-1-semialdehyde 2,1-aminomutase
VSRSSRLLERACKVIPGGVNSPVRAFGAVGGNPPFITRGEGAFIYDEDGHPYLDMVCSWGALMLGHANPQVLGAATVAAAKGTTFGAPTAMEVRLAELICDAVPSIEAVRLCCSGTEATMHAVRLARGCTERDLIVKMEGCYHGAHDSLLVQAGSGVATFAIPGSPGIPASVAENTLVVPFNDLTAVQEMFRTQGKKIAAVILEPVAGNMGCILPLPGYLEGLREVTREYGSLLIFDEVITGFRVGRGGAQEAFGVVPDLTTLGKVVGGGFPMAAFGGRADLMNMLAPVGPIYQAGTLSGNPVAVAAGIATLEQLDDAMYDHLEKLGHSLENQLKMAAAYHGCSLRRLGSMLTVFFREAPPDNFTQVKECDTDAFGRFFLAALNGGVYLPPSQFETAFLSSVLSERQLGQIVEGLTAALVAAAA